jgi:hypothetical protein
MDTDVNLIKPNDLEDNLPNHITELLQRLGEGPALLPTALSEEYSTESLSPPSGDPKTREQRIWQLVGIYILRERGPFEAIPIFNALYDQMLRGQEELGLRVHKGMPLVHLSDCYRMINFIALAKRYAMLTLIEDAILYAGDIDLNLSGASRLIRVFGLAGNEFERYVELIYRNYLDNNQEAFFPEWVLQELDQDWKTEIPALQEAATYVSNPRYINLLYANLGDRSGKSLERLADYLLASIPGCRTRMRRRSASTEYDIVCSIEGARPDFLSDVKRYFVCECKDTVKPASYTVIAKFCRVLDSTKSNFGIIFSPKGISGAKTMRYAERERIKVYQDRQIAIVVVDKSDLEFFAGGGDFISRLRSKYESLRLDLHESRS